MEDQRVECNIIAQSDKHVVVIAGVNAIYVRRKTDRLHCVQMCVQRKRVKRRIGCIDRLPWMQHKGIIRRNGCTGSICEYNIIA